MISDSFECFWQSEEICLDQRSYLQLVLQEIAAAEHSVCVEMYIFRDDPVGQQLMAALQTVADRGVKVRIIVDGVGSPRWNEARLKWLLRQRISARIYHPVPNLLPNLLHGWRSPGAALERLPKLLASINKRNHRKLILVDERVAILGSCNITAATSDWREAAVSVTGAGVADLLSSFELIWSRASHPTLPRPKRLRARKLGPGDRTAVRLNYTNHLRVRFNADLAARIERASQRVWISNAYFVPSPAILAALVRARRNRCDVKILVPNNSDVSLVEIVSRLFYRGLMSVGIEIYEYQPSMMHAKSLLIDDHAIVGTSNLNHRSLYHDLEVDVLLDSKPALAALTRQFEADLQFSRKVTAEWLERRSWFEKISALLIYPFRRFI